MKKRIFLYALIAFFITSCDNSTQTEQKLSQKERPSDKYDQQCKSTEEAHLNSGQPSRMRTALANANACLEKEIVKLSGTRVVGQNSVLTIEKSLNLLSTGYQRLYWEISTESADCSPACGSMNQVTHVLKYNELLRSIIDDLLQIEVQ